MFGAFIAGRLGKDAQVRQLPSGSSVVEFTVATDKYISKEKKVTTWTKVVCFKPKAVNMAPYLLKGKSVVVRGEVYNEEYEGKYFLKCDADDIQFGEGAPKERADAAQSADTEGVTVEKQPAKPARRESKPKVEEFDLDV